MNKNSTKNSSANRPPLRVPLSFDQLVEGIMAVDPKKLPPKAAPGVSKAKDLSKNYAAIFGRGRMV